MQKQWLFMLKNSNRNSIMWRRKIVSFDMVENVTRHIPGGGDEHNIVKCTIPLLEKYSNYEKWIDVCKNWTE